MKIIEKVKALLGFARNPSAWADERLAQALTCPECGHHCVSLEPDAVMASPPECRCDDPRCACLLNAEFYDREA
jgi:hypothetical protein